MLEGPEIFESGFSYLIHLNYLRSLTRAVGELRFSSIKTNVDCFYFFNKQVKDEASFVSELWHCIQTISPAERLLHKRQQVFWMDVNDHTSIHVQSHCVVK